MHLEFSPKMYAKSKLQELLQKEGSPLPKYEVKEDAVTNLFIANVTARDKIYYGAFTKSKTTAEASAAENALSLLKVTRKITNPLDPWREKWCKQMITDFGFPNTAESRYYLTCAFLHASATNFIKNSKLEPDLHKYIGVGTKGVPNLVIPQEALTTVGESISKYILTTHFLASDLTFEFVPTSGNLVEQRARVDSREDFKRTMIDFKLDKYVMYQGEMNLSDTHILSDILYAIIAAAYYSDGIKFATALMRHLKFIETL